MSAQIWLRAVKQSNEQKLAKICLKISKIDEKPASQHKTHYIKQNYIKQLQATINTPLKIIIRHLNPKKMKEGFKKPHMDRIFRLLREIVFTSQFLDLLKTAVWTKTTRFLLHSSSLFNVPTTPNFSSVSFGASKFTPIKFIKKTFLQILWTVKKSGTPQ